MRLEIKSVKASQLDLILFSEKAVSYDARGFLLSLIITNDRPLIFSDNFLIEILHGSAN